MNDQAEIEKLVAELQRQSDTAEVRSIVADLHARGMVRLAQMAIKTLGKLAANAKDSKLQNNARQALERIGASSQQPYAQQAQDLLHKLAA
jgi:hypothetical protein